uniref:Caspase-8 n=1 Tax=Maylandia zebra TaxID=106582 RepID=A0A3P9BYY5_9CICH
MERNQIICKVTDPTDWVNALVVVEKPKTGRLRVCLDPRPLNKAIQRPHYPLPTLEDVTTKLAGAKYFSVLDARSGYWAIKLSHESSLLTTFNTVFGRYRFLRLPFGIISAQDEFQRRVDETYEGLRGVAAIVDDVLVFGETKQEHDDNLRAMLQRSRERGVKLNPDKCTICVKEVSYFGHTLSHEGLKPDPQKVKAVQDMAPPQNRAELETVLGMVNYLARFAPHLSEINAPLRQLLKQDSEFVWDKNHDRAFQRMKELITREPGPVLSFFDPKKALRLQVDASKSGLGAVMLQDGKPVAYASKSLNSTEQNYAQIEKELYAVLFGCKRFHEYMYGRHVTIESDHKPLESILKKTLASDVYQIISRPVGLFVIINNKNFKDGSQRRGTDKDAQSLAEVFSWLGFRVLMCEDLNKDQMDQALTFVASLADMSHFVDPQQVLEHGDAFICSILSHGKKGVVLGTDRNPLPIKEITRKFRGCDQSVLTGKPKVFLIQACQGSNIQRAVQMNDMEIDDDTSPLTIPEEADVLVAMATVEDHASLRHIVDGSWFVQSLCEQLKERCPRGEDIVSILHYVNDDVAHRETSLLAKQMPEVRFTLRKKLVLQPQCT